MNIIQGAEWLDWQTSLGFTWGQILSLVIIAVVAFFLERVVTRYLRRFARRTHLSLSVSNSLILTFRILILIGSIASATRVSGLTTEWFLAFSALGGAAVGLASSQTLGNFVAGLYLLSARPFRVGDYVRAGTVEGIVQEITINYTKILTIANNLVSIANLQILQRDLTNYFYEGDGQSRLYCYTFEIGFDHRVPANKIAEIFDEVFERHSATLPRKPTYILVRSGGFERVYMIYLYVEKPEAIFTLRPQIMEEVFERWDKERAAANT